ncbi:hypothetical protein M0R45_035021 [Rubus argutus]|uniref:Uncharacterized protein n=1 Tax=Rubus argutus TaxID=59490 RepID=A0AAW1VRY3_RUBAR
MQPSQSSCAAQPIVELRSVVHAWREEEAEGQLHEGWGEEEDEIQVIEEQPSHPPVERCVTLDMYGERVEDVGPQEGRDDIVQIVDMQPLQSSCPAHSIVEPHSIVHACREEGTGEQLQEGRQEEGVRVTEEQPSQSSEPVQTTVDIGKVVQRLDDLVERFTHLEQRTEARDRRRNSEYQFVCSEFFTLSLHLGYSANARDPPIPPSFSQGSAATRSTS